jgi:hypothetical protein
MLIVELRELRVALRCSEQALERAAGSTIGDPFFLRRSGAELNVYRAGADPIPE